ncbi:MAG: DUF983 domain-containing protein [Pseudonocardiaceae bacterium]|nr:DUF983 domain-containing protein [Pseudonocardiaceae bacterium]
MTRVVRGADGRMWTVRSNVNWSEPATAQEFEHDVAAGQVAGVTMLLVVVALVLIVVLWTPTAVVVPGWLVFAFLVLLLALPVQWAMGRSWTIVAETPPLPDAPPERWVGTVHGVMLARQETLRVARSLQRDAIPDDGRGPLQPVN